MAVFEAAKTKIRLISTFSIHIHPLSCVLFTVQQSEKLDIFPDIEKLIIKHITFFLCMCMRSNSFSSTKKSERADKSVGGIR